MNNLSSFDILGPIMIGPSSSHTAGAVRIGNLAKEIVGKPIKKVSFYLHGSFKETYRGHGTDKALLGGLLGLSTDDYLIKKSFELAKKKGIEFEFIPTDLEDVHPNTVKLELVDFNGELISMIASSIGGGNIMITEINGVKVELNGEYFTLISIHKDRPGMIAKIANVLQKYDLNIATMKVLRQSKATLATAIIELDADVNEEILKCIESIPEIESIRIIHPIV